MEDYTIAQCENADRDFIAGKLLAYNVSQVASAQDIVKLGRKLVDPEGRILAGLLGYLYCGDCLYVEVLWVDEGVRQKGFGARLLQEAEAAAKQSGCYLAHLDTFDFQAKDFYQKQGYELFGVLDDCPRGHKRYFLKKRLD